jgi:nicotinamide phosphoribosyltransferase
MKNLILATDSYKASQWKQYPPNTAYISSYIEARGGMDESVFFGLQAYLKEYLSTPVTLEMIDEAEDFLVAHGEPFNREGWDLLVTRHDGKLPIRIEAVPEGTVMGTGNVQVQVVNTDPDFYWLTSYLETAMLRAVWYPSTVATISRNAKKIIADGLKKSSDIPIDDQISFKLHDFGARGVSSAEGAMLGGMGHLVNFMGTDTVEALVGARKYYNEPMAGFSIPASEHSTMTSWGRENEKDAYENMINVFSGEGKLLAFVADSYDIYNAASNIIGEELKELIQNTGGTVVVRPDSGDPTEVPIKIIEILMDKFGYSVNSKGYKVLPDCIRVIQGDGINSKSLEIIVRNMLDRKLSIDNIAFGMGGGLLQHCNRDDLKYAMKCSARMDTDGVWHDVYKSPISGGKTSKKGRLGLVYECGLGVCGYRTMLEQFANEKGNLLEVVYENGEIVKEYSLAEVRANAAIDYDKKQSEGRYD